MKQLGPALAVSITDYSVEPAALLRDLSDPLLDLTVSQQPAVLAVRRGWVHGSHLTVVARGHQGPHTDRLRRSLDDFAREAGAIAVAGSRAGLQPPATATYLTRAAQLARWENRRPPFLPLYPQGHVRVDDLPVPDGWTAVLAGVRDQITGRYLAPILQTSRVPAADLVPTLMRVMAVLARSHPAGIGVGTLPYRSHVEGVSSATGNHADVRGAYAQRFPQDHAAFRAALLEPVSDPLLLSWREAFGYAWGAAEGLAGAGILDDTVLAQAAGRHAEFPMGAPVRSDFFAEMHSTGLILETPYQHVAYRLVLNTLYSTLSCFGVTPLQRYYLCYGLAEAADRHLGEDGNTRIRRIAADRAARHAPLEPALAAG